MWVERNLLFGVLALQADLIDRDQFAEACQAWAARKEVHLADLLIERGWLTPEARGDVDRQLEHKLHRHGGDASASLAVSTTDEAPQGRESLHDVALGETVDDLGLGSRPLTVSTGAHQPERRARYTLTRLHAKGGIGQVWRARDDDLGREVALKELRPERDEGPAVWARFLEEARITGQLEHPGIVPVYELVRPSAGTKPFYTMRFVRGRTFSEAVRDYHQKRLGATAGPLDLRALLSTFVAVCNAVAYAHSRGVIHRDLKGQNVVLGDFGEVMVLDWGLAKVLGRPEDETNLAPVELEREEGHEATMPGTVLGTPAYMAPEQAEGRLDRIDQRTDVYGLGAMLYEVLTGAPPFRGADLQQLLRSVLHEAPARPRTRVPATDPALEAVCLKALAKQPGERYSSAGDLARDVERWLGDEPVSAWREPWHVRVDRWARRHKTIAAAILAGLLMTILLGSAGAWWLVRQRAERRSAVEAELTQTEQWQARARWQQAQAALGRAEVLLQGGGPADLRRRYDQARSGLDLVARLDAIRLARATMVEGKFDFPGADRDYQTAFLAAGLGSVGDECQVVAARIHASPVRAELVAALDDWASSTGDLARQAWLLAVARLADPGPAWRDRARDPAVWSDRAALERLVGEEEAAAQAPPLVDALATRLRKLGGDASDLLRKAAVRHRNDFWLNVSLGNALWQRDPKEAAGYYRAALALRPDTSAILANLANALFSLGRDAEAMDEYQKAIDLDPGNGIPHNGLGNVLYRLGQHDQARAQYEEALRLPPRTAHPHNGLGNILADAGRWQEAMAEYQQAIQLDSGDSRAHNGLGNVLFALGRYEEAMTEFRAAAQLDPSYAHPHNGLGSVLYTLRRYDEAIAEYRQAIPLDRTAAPPHHGLGNALADLGRPKEALAEYQEAVRLDPKYAPGYYGLGTALAALGQPEEAIRAYRQAMEFNPRFALPHNALGLVLASGGRLKEAMVEFHKASQLDSKFAAPHSNLGMVLQAAGLLEQAIAEYRKAVELGLEQARPLLSACEHQLALRRRLPGLASGTDQPADQAERLAFAALCQQPFERRYALAARLYADAFAADPHLADDMRQQHRYNAACAAALAGCGRDAALAGSDEGEQTRLRRQALDWLKADLAYWKKQAQSDQPAERDQAMKTLRHWRKDADLAGVRGEALQKLPAAEAAAWSKFWQEVDPPATNPPPARKS